MMLCVSSVLPAGANVGLLTSKRGTADWIELDELTIEALWFRHFGPAPSSPV